MNKHIEEMALAMASEVRTCLVECECKDCGWHKTDNCPLMDYTKRLSSLGYRKSTDVARNIFGNLRILGHIDFDGNFCIRKDSFEALEKNYTASEELR